jgi:hypothetical protein
MTSAIINTAFGRHELKQGKPVVLLALLNLSEHKTVYGDKDNRFNRLTG